MTLIHQTILLLTILLIAYRYSFWFYVIQLKEYRWDRFSEYLQTPQGKKALFNFGIFIEFLVFITILILFLSSNFEKGIYYTIISLFLIENIFVILKIFRKKILKPKITGRLVITISILIILHSINVYFIGQNPKVIFSYILINLLLTPFIIFLGILISLPIVNKIKKIRINKAILKSKEINNPIKIAITGSVGKSSMKEFLATILSQDSKTLKTPENINTELGVANIVIKKLDNTFKYFVSEAGAYKIGEIETLGNIINHTYGFLTSIGNQHLGLFGNIENIKKAKFEISKKVLKNSGILYINWDDENIRSYVEQNKEYFEKINLVKYGLYRSDLDAKSIIKKHDNKKNIISFEYKKNKFNIEINIPGKHNTLNLTGILAFCIDIGIKKELIIKYSKNLQLPENTIEIIEKGNITLINATHNLSEKGLFAGIELLDDFKKIENILVLDDILELGKQGKNIHFEIGRKIALEKIVQKILFCGVNYKKYFEEGLIEGGFKKENIIDSLSNINLNSVILFEGKKARRYIRQVPN